MDQRVYIPLEQPIEGLPNATEMMHNKYDLKSLMENSSFQNTSPEFIKIVDHNLIIDDDDMIFENFQQNDTNDITEEEQNLILSAFQSVITSPNIATNQLGGASTSSSSQIPLTSLKITKSKMYEIEEPFFKDFDDILLPQPPSYDDHIETVPGSLHRPILPIDTLFPTDDMMYQNGSLVMQNGEKYILTNDMKFKENENLESEKIPDDLKLDSENQPQAQVITPQLVSPQITPNIRTQTISYPQQSPIISQPLVSQQIPQQNASPYISNPLQQQNIQQPILNPQLQPQIISPYTPNTPIQQNVSSYSPNTLQQPNISSYNDNSRIQQSSEQNINNNEFDKPLFQFIQPPQLPPFMPPPLDDMPQTKSAPHEPFYRNLHVHQPQALQQPSSNLNKQPSYRPIEKPKYPQLNAIPENNPQPIPQKQPQPNPKPQRRESNNDDILFNQEPAAPKKKKKMEAMPC